LKYSNIKYNSFDKAILYTLQNSMIKLSHLYIFEWFQNNFLEHIQQNSQREFFQKWSIVLHEGEISYKAYIVEKWIISVSKNGHIINTIFEWDIFWEIALVTNEPRTATITAETDLKLLSISKNTLFEIIKNYPDGEVIKTTILNRIIQNIKTHKHE